MQAGAPSTRRPARFVGSRTSDQAKDPHSDQAYPQSSDFVPREPMPEPVRSPDMRRHREPVGDLRVVTQRTRERRSGPPDECRSMRRWSESGATCLDVRVVGEYRRGGLRTTRHKIVTRCWSPIKGTVATRQRGLTCCAISNPGTRGGGDQPMSLAPEVR